MSDIKLAMLGMVDGNGHPYSWSAIINGGFNEEEMKKCPYPVIYDYLSKEPRENLGIQGAVVTHIWCDNPDDAISVAKASFIPNVVSRPEDVLGEVDAVIIPTDRGNEHVERAKLFIEKGVPVFIDKPLADNEEDLRQFVKWVNEGKMILSSSCMRYAREFSEYRDNKRLEKLVGKINYISITTPKTWERYGIHALEAVYPILKPGFYSVRNSGNHERNIVHIKHDSGADLVIAAIKEMHGAFGNLFIGGTEGKVYRDFEDTFYAFKSQLEAFVEYLKTGKRPFPFEETVELMKIIIAGIKSRDNGGAEILLKDIDI